MRGYLQSMDAGTSEKFQEHVGQRDAYQLREEFQNQNFSIKR